MTSQGGLRAWRTRIALEKRNAILDAAVAAFVENGYAATTLEAVAIRAKVSTGTLFKHFPSKAALFGAIMERVWEVGAAAAAAAPAEPNAPFEALTHIGLDYARLLRAPGVEGLFRVIVAEATRFPELGRTLYERGKKPYLHRVQETLSAAEAAGHARIADPALAARQFLGMINDLIFWPRLLVPDLAVTEADVDHVVTEAAHTFLARYGTAATGSGGPDPEKRKRGRPVA